MAAGLDPSLAGHKAASSQDLPFGHPSLLRTDLRAPDKWWRRDYKGSISSPDPPSLPVSSLTALKRPGAHFLTCRPIGHNRS